MTLKTNNGTQEVTILECYTRYAHLLQYDNKNISHNCEISSAVWKIHHQHEMSITTMFKLEANSFYVQYIRVHIVEILSIIPINVKDWLYLHKKTVIQKIKTINGKKCSYLSLIMFVNTFWLSIMHISEFIHE